MLIFWNNDDNGGWPTGRLLRAINGLVAEAPLAERTHLRLMVQHCAVHFGLRANVVDIDIKVAARRGATELRRMAEMKSPSEYTLLQRHREARQTGVVERDDGSSSSGTEGDDEYEAPVPKKTGASSKKAKGQCRQKGCDAAAHVPHCPGCHRLICVSGRVKQQQQQQLLLLRSLLQPRRSQTCARRASRSCTRLPPGRPCWGSSSGGWHGRGCRGGCCGRCCRLRCRGPPMQGRPLSWFPRR